MSNKAQGWAWDQTTDKPIDKMVLVALADYAAKDGYSYPSHRELAEMVQCSVDTVQRAIKRLLLRDLIRVERRWRDNGGKTSNGYTVLYLGPDTGHGSGHLRVPDGGDTPPPEPGADQPPHTANCGDPMPQTAASHTAPVRHPIPQLCGMQYDPSLDPSPEHTHTPTAPEPVCVTGGNPVDELRQLGDHPAVVEAYIAPLFGCLRWPPGVHDRTAFLRGVAETLRTFPSSVLAVAADLTRAQRSTWPSAAQALQIATKAAARVEPRRIDRGTAGYAAWLAAYRGAGKSWWATSCEERGYVLEHTEFPVVDKGRAA